MPHESAIVVDLSEYRRQRQARENAAQDHATQAGAPLMWCWVWFFPMGLPTIHAHQA